MAFGLAAPGPGPDGALRTRNAYLTDMRAVADQGVIDILLTSASNGEELSRDGSLNDGITLAVRANDSTDIWNPRGGSYPTSASRPFRTAELSSLRTFCDLVLYSVTFNHNADRDVATLSAYRDFRREADEQQMRHFLEVFNPNAQDGLAPEDFGSFLNDSIVRMLAGVTAAHRPTFLKIAYNGRAALAELSNHDPTLIVGVLGGSTGTTRDTYELLRRTEQAGGRVALFGRKIQRAERQLDLVAMMRPVLRGQLSPADAVREYHDALARAQVVPKRSLPDDLQVTDPVLRAE